MSTRNEFFKFRLAPDEKERYQKLSEVMNRPLAEVIRVSLDHLYKKKVEEKEQSNGE